MDVDVDKGTTMPSRKIPISVYLDPGTEATELSLPLFLSFSPCFSARHEFGPRIEDENGNGGRGQ